VAISPKAAAEAGWETLRFAQGDINVTAGERSERGNLCKAVAEVGGRETLCFAQGDINVTASRRQAARQFPLPSQPEAFSPRLPKKILLKGWFLPLRHFAVKSLA